MPNWIKNKIIVGSAKIVEQLIESYGTYNEKTKVLEFDLDKLIPMPKDLEIEFSTKSDEGLLLYLTKINQDVDYYGTKEDKLTKEEYNNIISHLSKHVSNRIDLILSKNELEKLLSRYDNNVEELLTLGKKQVANVLNYDALNWYEWRIKNWGCKWNSDNLTIGDKGNTFSFETPWDPPLGAIIKLSELNPSIRLALLFSDEDIGSHVGYMLLQNGRIDYKGSFKNKSIDAYKLAFELWGCEDEYELDEANNTYVYKNF
jgi:hypothetical protein